MASPSPTPDLLALTAQIVTAHVAGNKVAADAVPGLIRSVHDTLAHIGAPAPAVAAQEPAVPVKRSVQHDYLVCLEDGAKVKMLRRYLQRFGLTPDSYRAKWNLPPDYPMTAPAYAAQRSALAKQFGLGTALRTVPQEAAEPPAFDPAPVPPTVDPDAHYTAASVFANFPGAEPEPAAPAEGTEKPGRKRFAQQSMLTGRRRQAAG